MKIHYIIILCLELLANNAKLSSKEKYQRTTDHGDLPVGSICLTDGNFQYLKY